RHELGRAGLGAAPDAPAAAAAERARPLVVGAAVPDVATPVAAAVAVPAAVAAPVAATPHAPIVSRAVRLEAAPVGAAEATVVAVRLIARGGLAEPAALTGEVPPVRPPSVGAHAPVAASVAAAGLEAPLPTVVALLAVVPAAAPGAVVLSVAC